MENNYSSRKIKSTITSNNTGKINTQMSKTTDKKRMAYVLNDINAIDTSSLVPYEILMDYAKNDLVMIKSDGTVMSILEYINGALNMKLDDTHLTLPNQHKIATLEESGFMSNEDKILLGAINDEVSDIQKLIANNKVNEPFVSSNISYILEGNIIKFTGGMIENGIFLTPMVGQIDMGIRPSSDSINSYGKQGYVDSMLVMESRSLNTPLMIKKYDDVLISPDDSTLIYKESTYIYDSLTHVYRDGVSDLFIVPVLLISRRNDDYITAGNPMGKLSDLSLSHEEIRMIGRVNMPNITPQALLISRISEIKNDIHHSNNIKILSSNIVREIDVESDILYVPLSGDDTCKVTGFALNKECSYTNSPYGEMMKRANALGDVMTITPNDCFTLNFIIKKDAIGIKSGSIIKLKDSIMRDKIDITYNTNNTICVTLIHTGVVDIKHTIELSGGIIDDIRITFDEYNELQVFVNNEYATSESGIPFNANSIYNVLISSIDVPIGNIILSKDLSYINPNVAGDTSLLETFTALTTNTKKLSKNISVKYGDILDDKDITFKFELRDSTKISTGDLLNIYFDNDIADMYNGDMSKMVYVTGNMCGLNDAGLFDVGDTIKIIGPKFENINNRYTITSKLDNNITLDKIIDSDFIGYNVVNILDANTVTVNSGDINMPVVINDHSAKVIISRDMPIDSIFNISMVESTIPSNIVSDINSINTVKFDNRIYITSSTEKSISNISLSMVQKRYNGEYISGNTVNGVLVGAPDNSNSIDFELVINTNDYIRNVDMIHLSDIIDIFGRLDLTAGNHKIMVNGTDLAGISNVNQVGSTPIDLSMFKVDGPNLILTITAIRSDKTKLYVYIKDMQLEMISKLDLFAIKDGKRIIQFVGISDTGIYSNSDMRMDIITDGRMDSYVVFTGDYITISEEIDGYKLILDECGLLKVLEVNNSKLYDFGYKYIR